MDIGSPVRVLPEGDFSASLPSPELEDSRTQCSVCCGVRVAGGLFAISTLICAPFSAMTHGVMPPKPTAAAPSFRHPLSSTAKQLDPLSRFFVSDGGGLYASGAQKEAPARGQSATPFSSKPIAAPTAPSGRGRNAMARARNVASFYADRYLFHSLPFACVAFTHQWIVSQLMWSKAEKTALRINLESLGVNTVLWLLGAFVSRRVFRGYLVPRNKTARLSQFEWERKQRAKKGMMRVAFSGSLSSDFSSSQIVLLLVMYSIVWGTATMVNEHLFSNHYSNFHGMMPWYSRSCAPRWREWRENEIRKKKEMSRVKLSVQELGERSDQSLWGAAKISRPNRVQ